MSDTDDTRFACTSLLAALCLPSTCLQALQSQSWMHSLHAHQHSWCCKPSDSMHVCVAVSCVGACRSWELLYATCEVMQGIDTVLEDQLQQKMRSECAASGPVLSQDSFTFFVMQRWGCWGGGWHRGLFEEQWVTA